MIPIDELIKFAENDVVSRIPRVGVYWYECGTDRQGAAKTISEAESHACLIPLLPHRGFNNTNALLADLVELIEQERSIIEPIATSGARDNRPVCLILVSRTRLAEPIIASPVKLPEWFPYSGGSVVSLDILDVASSASGTLRSQSEGLTRIQIELYEIEGLMLARIEDVVRRNQNVTHKFFAEILKQEMKPTAFLNAANERHKRSSPEGFRAVASPDSSELLGRLIGTIGERSPSQLPSLGRSLFAALELSEADALRIREPLFAVSLRSTNKDFEGDSALRAMRNAVLAIYCGSQLVTAAAHAGEYGTFEVVVMRSMLLDCHGTLAGFKAVLI